MMLVQFFHRPESNKVDPRTLPCVPYVYTLPEDWTLVQMLDHAYTNGLPKGSARCGCVEIQTDIGIYVSHHGGRIQPDKAIFRTWEEVEAADDTCVQAEG